MSKTKMIKRYAVPNVQIVDMPDQLPQRLQNPKMKRLYDEIREYARSKGFEMVLSSTK